MLLCSGNDCAVWVSLRRKTTWDMKSALSRSLVLPLPDAKGYLVRPRFGTTFVRSRALEWICGSPRTEPSCQISSQLIARVVLHLCQQKVLPLRIFLFSRYVPLSLLFSALNSWTCQTAAEQTKQTAAVLIIDIHTDSNLICPLAKNKLFVLIPRLWQAAERTAPAPLLPHSGETWEQVMDVLLDTIARC